MLKPAGIREPGPIFLFGPYRLEPDEGLLSRGGEVVALPPKVFDLLVALVTREGRLATRDELLHAIWPDTFVDEANLTQSIFTLRRLLGADGTGTVYVETVPRRGYRFAGPVQRVTRGPDPGDAPLVAPVGVPVSRRGAIALLGGAVVAVAGLGTWARTLGPRSAPAFSPGTFTPITTTGDVVDAAMSWDGRFIAYSRLEAAQATVWLHQVAIGSGVRILEAADARVDRLTFSRDGEHLYFTQRAGKADALFRVPVTGGVPQRLIDNVSSPAASGPDGRLAFVQWRPSMGVRALVVTGADGRGARDVLVRRSPEVIVYQGASWSPDGRRLAVIVNESFGGRTPALVIVDVATGDERILSGRLPWNAGKVAWEPGGAGIIVAAGQLWRVNLGDGSAVRITREASNYGHLAFAADGRSLMALQRTEVSTIWVEEDGVSREVHGESGFNHGLAWMGTDHLIFESGASGEPGLAITAMDGTVRRIGAGGATENFPAVAPDGTLVLATTREGGSVIVRRRVDGSGARVISGPGAQYAPDVSPDGRWVAYHRADERLSWRLWRVAIDGGAPAPLCDAASTFAAHSPDGRTIACNLLVEDAHAWHIAILPASGGRPLRVLPVAGPPTRRLAWSPDGRTIYYSAPDEALWRVDLAGGSPRRVLQFPGERVQAFRWSPDGRRLAYVRQRRRDDVMLIRSGVE